uniref:Uncharacterized protein n=1 Tax=Cacopsylla melanoneura TaxID=428564 RepID=A0A8D8UYB5_9HEMI
MYSRNTVKRYDRVGHYLTFLTCRMATPPPPRPPPSPFPSLREGGRPKKTSSPRRRMTPNCLSPCTTFRRGVIINLVLRKVIKSGSYPTTSPASGARRTVHPAWSAGCLATTSLLSTPLRNTPGTMDRSRGTPQSISCPAGLTVASWCGRVNHRPARGRYRYDMKDGCTTIG